MTEKNLVIVESPAKARTIKKFLGQNYEVESSMGHIRDLPKGEFGIDITNGFKPKYVIAPDKIKTVRKLQEMAKKNNKVYLASDHDREGEAIAFHLSYILKKYKRSEDIYRVVFNEITKPAILSAVKNPGKIDLKKVEAQQARRILDRIFGYKISPLLWKVITSGLSAGRVQTVALRLLAERERKIQAFKPEEYWTITAYLNKKLKFSSYLVKFDNKEIKIKNEKKANEIYYYLVKQSYTVQSVKKQTGILSPPPPFITSTLQQEASRILRFSTKRTMMIAQQLYEGIDLDGETTGIISYMRTDSTRISSQANMELRKLIKERYKEKYLQKRIRIFKNKNTAQDAHEAIRPTSSYRTPDSIKRFLSNDQYKLYDLIWRRFVATQMTPAKLEFVTININAGKGLFRSQGTTILFDGFMKVYSHVSIKNSNVILPDLKAKDLINLEKLEKQKKFTSPPLRYTEASLVKKLEYEGIGRPSTYASIITTLLARKYATLVQRKFITTELGLIVEKFLISKFSDIFNTKFTAEMEAELDKVEQGSYDMEKVLNEYYNPLAEQLEKISISKEKEKLQIETDIKCEKCGEKMVIKWGRNGKFLACPNFPKCKNTKNFTYTDQGKIKIVKEELLDELCPKCGSKLSVRSGKFGRFYACSNYPKCRYTRPFSIGIHCPEENCDGQIIERKSQKGKTFYGCSNYPKCDFITSYKPVNQECPKCGYKILVERSSKKDGDYLYCLRCKEKFFR